MDQGPNPDADADATVESGDRGPLERSQQAIDEAREAAREALLDPSPGTISSTDPSPSSSEPRDES